jgi:hypothetical protein
MEVRLEFKLLRAAGYRTAVGSVAYQTTGAYPVLLRERGAARLLVGLEIV